MANGHTITVVAATRRVSKADVAQPGTRPQLQWPVMINRSINVVVGQKRGNVSPKAAAPFCLGAFRVLLACLGNQRRVYRGIELLGGARHHENVVTIAAEMIAVLLKQ
jgi:hypothetical protein